MHFFSTVSRSPESPTARCRIHGPARANGTEPMISHLARVQFGWPFLACVIAPPDL